MGDVTALSARQRRDLHRLDRALDGDTVLCKLAALFPAPPRPQRKPRAHTVLWCVLAVLAGLAVTIAGAAWVPAVGVLATAVVVVGATATAAGLAFLLTAVTTSESCRGRVWPQPR